MSFNFKLFLYFQQQNCCCVKMKEWRAYKYRNPNDCLGIDLNIPGTQTNFRGMYHCIRKSLRISTGKLFLFYVLWWFQWLILFLLPICFCTVGDTDRSRFHKRSTEDADDLEQKDTCTGSYCLWLGWCHTTIEHEGRYYFLPLVLGDCPANSFLCTYYYMKKRSIQLAEFRDSNFAK